MPKTGLAVNVRCKALENLCCALTWSQILLILTVELCARNSSCSGKRWGAPCLTFTQPRALALLRLQKLPFSTSQLETFQLVPQGWDGTGCPELSRQQFQRLPFSFSSWTREGKQFHLKILIFTVRKGENRGMETGDQKSACPIPYPPTSH